MEELAAKPRRGRIDATVQVPRSRAKRTRMHLALTGIVAFAASLAVGALAMEAMRVPERLVAPQPRMAVRIAPRTIEVSEPAALVRLVAMERHRSARRR
jgi:hypothetical protein